MILLKKGIKNYFIYLNKNMNIDMYLNEINLQVIDFARMNNCEIHQLLFQFLIALKLVPIQHRFNFLISHHQKHHSLNKTLLIKGKVLLLQSQNLRSLLNH